MRMENSFWLLAAGFWQRSLSLSKCYAGQGEILFKGLAGNLIGAGFDKLSHRAIRQAQPPGYSRSSATGLRRNQGDGEQPSSDSGQIN